MPQLAVAAPRPGFNVNLRQLSEEEQKRSMAAVQQQFGTNVVRMLKGFQLWLSRPFPARWESSV